VSFNRRSTSFFASELSSCQSDLSYVSVALDPASTIEGAQNCIHADFANACIGGGVLSGGFYQEEIRFLIAPECLLSVLICERMSDTESILIRGAEQFSTYSGFASTFRFTGPFTGPAPQVDAEGFLCSFVVAMDATPFDSDDTDSQYDLAHSSREIVKVGEVTVYVRDNTRCELMCRGYCGYVCCVASAWLLWINGYLS
jgi:poly(ADP-ribose) glycohydrolase